MSISIVRRKEACARDDVRMFHDGRRSKVDERGNFSISTCTGIILLCLDSLHPLLTDVFVILRVLVSGLVLSMVSLSQADQSSTLSSTLLNFAV